MELLKIVVVMDEFVYKALYDYYHALELKGYLPYSVSENLLILCFYYRYLSEDYRGLLSKEDYDSIGMALNCLYGTNCLIPYPDYLKMSKLKLGEATELSQRIRNLEDTTVLKSEALTQAVENQSDVIFVVEE